MVTDSLVFFRGFLTGRVVFLWKNVVLTVREMNLHGPRYSFAHRRFLRFARENNRWERVSNRCRKGKLLYHTRVMERYIEQMLEIMREAHGNRPAPIPMDLPEDMECLRDVIAYERSMEEDRQTMEEILGVPKIYFPPEHRLTDVQIALMIEGILELWEAFHYQAEFREGEFNARQRYTKLVEKWKDPTPVLYGSHGTLHIEMYDYEDDWDEEDFA